MNDHSIAEYLLTHQFFSDLDDNFVEILAEYASKLKIKKGQMLFRQGEHADKF